MYKKYFTSESVTEGHPDKICDQISDAVLDKILENDPKARVACETLVTTGLVLVTGEITCNCIVDIPSVAKNTVKDIGYTDADYGFDYNTCAVITSIDKQSPDIALGVNRAVDTADKDLLSNEEIGAGDQGMMFGYACNQTPEYMPVPIAVAHRITRKLAEVRKSGLLNHLRPDGKSQVTVEYAGNKPIRVDNVVVATQHAPDVAQKTIHDDIIRHVIRPVIDEKLIDKNTRFLVNQTGRFVIGGPQGDSGVTGRKIIVDTYGGYARHGGGAFSGKDPTKVDRSAAYAARHAAKNIVAAGLAEECEIQLAYVIGLARPVSVSIDTFGTGAVPDEKISSIVMDVFDFRPASIIRKFDLRRPIYKQVASYGHFGRNDLELPWEKLDMVEVLKTL
ncbi:MAG: methionine adenosyltransferase [Desulfotomaculaceae bacterium]|nr:methionine adenosyltransferase [Desulfotomaculaceae bacterium]